MNSTKNYPYVQFLPPKAFFLFLFEYKFIIVYPQAYLHRLKMQDQILHQYEKNQILMRKCLIFLIYFKNVPFVSELVLVNKRGFIK